VTAWEVLDGGEGWIVVLAVAVADDGSGVAVVSAAAAEVVVVQESQTESNMLPQAIPAAMSAVIARRDRSSWMCCLNCTEKSCCLAGPSGKKSAGSFGRLGSLSWCCFG
jgi:hypothetical protein